MGAVSVCGSDVHQAWNTHSWPVNIPVVLGHEFGGTIARLGRAVHGFKEGDRVVSETAAEICGECMLCRTGRYNLCPSRKGFGYGVNGAMAQWVRVPARCLHHIPDTLPFDIACLSEPHAVVYNAMCMNVDDSAGRRRGRARARPHRPALRANGGAGRRGSADRRRPVGRRRATRGSAATRGDPHGGHADQDIDEIVRTCRRSVPTSCATHPASVKR